MHYCSNDTIILAFIILYIYNNIVSVCVMIKYEHACCIFAIHTLLTCNTFRCTKIWRGIQGENQRRWRKWKNNPTHLYQSHHLDFAGGLWEVRQQVEMQPSKTVRRSARKCLNSQNLHDFSSLRTTVLQPKARIPKPHVRNL